MFPRHLRLHTKGMHMRLSRRFRPRPEGLEAKAPVSSLVPGVAATAMPPAQGGDNLPE